MYASARLLSMKMAANTAVARDRAVRAPRAPNTVPEAPAPKPRARIRPFATLQENQRNNRHR